MKVDRLITYKAFCLLNQLFFDIFSLAQRLKQIGRIFEIWVREMKNLHLVFVNLLDELLDALDKGFSGLIFELFVFQVEVVCLFWI